MNETTHKFATSQVATSNTSIFVSRDGSGSPLLLLHGFPETQVMWRHVAPRLADRFSVVCADLRGYGNSGCPVSDADHTAYSKRAMARDMIEVMGSFGFKRFSVIGHDRGARVAYRLALDHPDRIDRIAVLDAMPLETVWQRADARFALEFWPWSLLAQPSPFAERVLMASAGAIVDHAFSEWGSPANVFPADVRAAYEAPLRDPEHARAICEEYRAAAGIDRVHDRADLASGRRITCPLLLLWSIRGALGSWYETEGGPLALWQEWSTDVQGHGLEAGHFFPEELPGPTADALAEFLAGTEKRASSRIGNVK
jgi:haloacetate dehalogenase